MCSHAGVAAFDLPPSIEAPSRARALVAEHACPEHAKESVEAAQLVATELATCAVLYGKPPVTLELECSGSELTVAVSHSAVGAPVNDVPVDEDGGLRSALLGRLTQAWGIEHTADGRRLWGRLATGAALVRVDPGTEARRGPAA